MKQKVPPKAKTYPVVVIEGLNPKVRLVARQSDQSLDINLPKLDAVAR